MADQSAGNNMSPSRQRTDKREGNATRAVGAVLRKAATVATLCGVAGCLVDFAISQTGLAKWTTVEYSLAKSLVSTILAGLFVVYYQWEPTASTPEPHQKSEPLLGPHKRFSTHEKAVWSARWLPMFAGGTALWALALTFYLRFYGDDYDAKWVRQGFAPIALGFGITGATIVVAVEAIWALISKYIWAPISKYISAAISSHFRLMLRRLQLYIECCYDFLTFAIMLYVSLLVLSFPLMLSGRGSLFTISGTVALLLVSMWAAAQELAKSEGDAGATTSQSQRNDGWEFWNLYLEPEVFRHGEGILGYPYYAWRESSDQRIGLSRPRYCTIAPDVNDLQFVFFEPLGLERKIGWDKVATVAGLLTFVIIIVAHNFVGGSQSTIYGTDPPIGLVVVSGLFLAMTVAALAGALWYVGILMIRWKADEFLGDAAQHLIPLRQLKSFRVLSADDAGAHGRNGQRATGYGLAASFDDGSELIISRNSWNHESAARTHRDLTALFIDTLERQLTRYDNRKSKRSSTPTDNVGVGDPAPSSQSTSVPDKL